MADPRFYDNRGPFSLAAIAKAAGAVLPAEADGGAKIFDLASLDGAGPQHLTFFAGGKPLKDSFLQSRAGFCLVPLKGAPSPPKGMTVLPVAAVSDAWAAIVTLFYPRAGLDVWAQGPGVSPDAKVGRDVILGPGTAVGARAEIGEGTSLGAGCAIGPGVTIGKLCEIGSNVTISHAHIGDRVTVLPGAQIGQPGFGFASSASGHVRIPQLGRVIIQDNVEIGAATMVDRGALRDTVIGEGTKIDNLVQVAHNVEIGRHCVIAAQTGIAGSCLIEDFVVMGGQVGLGDHCHIGTGARLAARTATTTGQALAGGHDYGGVPAKPLRQWIREVHAVSHLATRPRRPDHDQDDHG